MSERSCNQGFCYQGHHHKCDQLTFTKRPFGPLPLSIFIILISRTNQLVTSGLAILGAPSSSLSSSLSSLSPSSSSSLSLNVTCKPTLFRRKNVEILWIDAWRFHRNQRHYVPTLLIECSGWRTSGRTTLRRVFVRRGLKAERENIICVRRERIYI